MDTLTFKVTLPITKQEDRFEVTSSSSALWDILVNYGQAYSDTDPFDLTEFDHIKVEQIQQETV